MWAPVVGAPLSVQPRSEGVKLEDWDKLGREGGDGTEAGFDKPGECSSRVIVPCSFGASGHPGYKQDVVCALCCAALWLWGLRQSCVERSSISGGRGREEREDAVLSCREVESARGPLAAANKYVERRRRGARG